MVPTIVKIDLNAPPREQPHTVVHNRWHPEIPPVASVQPGEAFKVECMDWTGGQIGNNDSADDIKNVDLNQVHYLSGPIRVEGAQPGDILVVEILEVQAIQGHEWGYTGIFDFKSGGFLWEYYPRAAKTVWDFEGIYASSRHIHGVKFAGLIHPGVIGCAPSHELLREWNRREMALIATDPYKVPALAIPPTVEGAMVGALEGSEHGERVKLEGARTVPPREHGGNCDIKNLSRGSKVYFPVYVEGANLSVGDLHFSQGDGEISFCGAIEMAGVITLKTSIIKGGVVSHSMKNPIFLPGPVQPNYSRFLTFEGICVEDDGTQRSLDATLAYQQACLNCIRYFQKFGYSPEQIYMLISSAPVEGRIASVVDIPNACCTLAVPLDIFDFDVTPREGGPVKQFRGCCPIVTD